MKVIYRAEVEVPELGDRVRKARGDRRVEEVSVAAGLSGGYWRQIEAERCAVTREAIAAIESALGVRLVKDMELVEKESDR